MYNILDCPQSPDLTLLMHTSEFMIRNNRQQVGNYIESNEEGKLQVT